MAQAAEAGLSHTTLEDKSIAGYPGGPEALPKDLEKSRVTKEVKRQNAALAGTGIKPKSATASRFVINEQAREALRKLGRYEDASKFDPRQALLDNVQSAWRQRQIWEAMLNAVPEEDWAHIGKVPIPGSDASSKGARIEVIQRFLTEATKVAARTSKLAIDAGIEERMVRLAEEQSALIADTVRAGLIAGIGSLHLSPQAEKAAIEAALGSAATHLRALAAGGQEVIEGVARVVHS